MVFPLPLDFFPPLRLSTTEAHAFLTWGNTLLQQTLDAYHHDQFDPPDRRARKWKPISRKHDLTVYKRCQLKDTNEVTYLCTGRIDGTLDEVVMGRYADNTPDFRRISGIYRNDLVDCAVLSVIKKRSPEDPFFLSCFKWITVKSPGKGLVQNRDLCWYEQMGMTRDHKGKEVGYTLTESVDLPTCPLFKECVRAKFSVCYLYRRNKSGGVKVYMRGKNDAGGKVVGWVTDLKSAALWLRTQRAMAVAHAVIATALLEAGKKNTERPSQPLGKCHVCRAKASGFLSSSKQCAVCHCSTCSSCVAKVRVLSCHDFQVPQYELFCKKCVRLIHQVDLRAPENVKNPVEYAAAILAAPERSKISFLSSRESSCYTDDSGVGAEEERAHYDASVTSSYSRSSRSSRSSFQLLPQPFIRVKSHDHDEEAPYFTHSGASRSLLEHPTHDNLKKPNSSLIPAAFYDDPLLHNTTDADAGQHHHCHLPDDQHFAGRESETPMESSQASALGNKADVYSSSVDSFKTYDSSASTPSTVLLMAQFDQMNLIM